MHLRPYSAPPDLAGFKGPGRAGEEGEQERGEKGWEMKWGRERWKVRGIRVLLFPHFEPWVHKNVSHQLS